MRKIIVMEFLTVDGVMEAPEKWQFPYYTEDVAEFNKSQLLALDALLLGEATYKIFAASWPSRTKNEYGVADKLNSMQKFVVSSDLKEVEWNNSVLIKENVVEEIAKLKEQPGDDIGIVGSATLIQSLMAHNLIDEYVLLVHPIVLGEGKHLFNEHVPLTKLTLVESRTFESGIVLLKYAVST